MATYPAIAPSPPPLTDESTFEERLEFVKSGAQARLDAELDRLRSLGIIDEQGNLLNNDLPADMIPGSDRDFGG